MVFKAFDNHLVGGDILKAFKRVKKLLKGNTNARDKVLTSSQFNALSSKAPRHLKGILTTAYSTGMREGEILNLTWDKVDLKKRLIQLEATDTKDKEPREIPICNKLYNVLNAIPRAIHDHHVFLFKGKPIRDLRTGLRKACDDAGIPYGRFIKGGFVFHDLRHTFNTNMRKAGVPESVIMRVTGHSTREMFDRYNTVDVQDTRNAVNQLEAYLGNAYQNAKNSPSQQ
jgi:integrase